MFRLSKYFRYFKKEIFLGPLFKLIEAIFELLVPLVMAKMIDEGILAKQPDVIWKYGLVLVVLAVVGIGCSMTCQYFAARCSQGIGTVLRKDVYHKINELSLNQVSQFSSSSLITRLTNDVNQLQLAVAMLIRLAIRAPFLVIGSFIMACSINLSIALWFLVAIVGIVISLTLIMSISSKFYRVVQQKLDRISRITQENLEGQRVIRAFSCQKREDQRFDEAASQSYRSSLLVSRIAGLFNPVTSIITNLTIVAILYQGSFSVHLGTLTQGDLIALVNYMTQMFLALVVVANLFTIFTKASASGNRVNEVLDCEIVMKSGNEKQVNKQATILQLKDCSFSYNQSEAAVQHANITIQTGQTIGIIGGTGSGKTTLVHLLCRMLDAQQGQVLYYGKAIQDYSPEIVRSSIHLVMQKAILFSGTIRDNLLWADPSASDQQLWQALKTAQAQDFVQQLEKGLDSEVVQGGKNFSGGQRQRLCIARGLVGSPEVLILDDSTSALDYRTDYLLRQTLRHETKQMTVFFVSQRVATIAQADQIFVMDHGEIVSCGTHEELLESCEVYQQIVASQTKEEK